MNNLIPIPPKAGP